MKSFKLFLALNLLHYVAAFASPFNYWYCVDVAKNIDMTKPYAYNIGELPLVTWFNDSKPITTLNICKHMGSKLDHAHVNNGCLVCPYHGMKHTGKDSFGQSLIFEDKLWWSYQPTTKSPTTTPLWKNKDYNTIMFKMDVDANFQDCVFNTLDINHFAYIHDNLFGKNMPPVEYKFHNKNNKIIINYKYNVNKNIGLFKKNLQTFNNFQIFEYPYTSTAIVSLNDKEKLVINSNFLPLNPNKTRWIVTLKYNFWKSYFARMKLDLIMKYILHQDQVQMSKQASDNMLKRTLIYRKRLNNEDHFKELVRMFRKYEYPDMNSVMKLSNHNMNILE